MPWGLRVRVRLRAKELVPHLETERVNSASCFCQLSRRQRDGAEEPRLIHYTSLPIPASELRLMLLTEFQANKIQNKHVSKPERSESANSDRKLKSSSSGRAQLPTKRVDVSTSTEKCQRHRGRHLSGSKKAFSAKRYPTESTRSRKQSKANKHAPRCASLQARHNFFFPVTSYSSNPEAQRCPSLQQSLSCTERQSYTIRKTISHKEKKNSSRFYFLLQSWDDVQTILSVDGGEKKEEYSDEIFFVLPNFAHSSKVASICNTTPFIAT